MKQKMPEIHLKYAMFLEDEVILPPGIGGSALVTQVIEQLSLRAAAAGTFCGCSHCLPKRFHNYSPKFPHTSLFHKSSLPRGNRGGHVMLSGQEGMQANSFLSPRANLKRLKQNLLKLGNPRRQC